MEEEQRTEETPAEAEGQMEDLEPREEESEEVKGGGVMDDSV